MTNYKSQIGQDKYISEHIFNNKKKGFFIELGAGNGVELSNTYFFEKELGWDGICIEPNPKYKNELLKNRNCKLSFNPVYSTSNKDVEFDVVNCGLFSGIKNHLGYIGDCKVEDTIVLKTKTLTDILDELNAPRYIDYLSLDTEGSELEILKGLDFNKYIIGYMNVEHNFQPLRNDIHKFLYEKQYIYSRWNSFDDEFIHPLLAEKFKWKNATTDMNINIG